MPNRATHVRVGSLSGAVAASLFARGAPTKQFLVEMLGGAVGGMLPDLLEPASCPNHRQFAHSVLAGGALATSRVADWRAACCGHAERATALLRDPSTDSDTRNRAEWAACLWHFAAGALTGVVAGYASHLVLDAGTPRGLPLVGG
jgi:membrane-bound metal-dependent hydrolase YbcI (DUF457 family)